MAEEAVGLFNPDSVVGDLLSDKAQASIRLATWILGDPEAARDAVQQAVMIAWERRRSIRDIESAEAWFNRILTNVCRDEIRRRQRRSLLPTVRSVVDPVGDPDEELAAAMKRLKPDDQVILALRYARDLTVPLIAREIGLPEGTVKSRLHHALEHLRALIEAERR